MEFYMFVLFSLKIFFLLDFFIGFALYCLLVKGESYYMSEKVSLAPKIVLWGYAMHYCFLFFAAGLMDWSKYPIIIMYIPYMLVAIYIIYIGILIFKNKEIWTALSFIAHGLSSFIIPLYSIFSAATTN